MTDLFPFQQEGVKFLASRRRALLLDEPGLGKTLQAIRASDELDIDGMNVICPASVRTQWRHAYAADSIRPKDFESHSYENARDKGMEPRNALVLDEQHFLKNSSSKRTKAIFGTKPYGTNGLINDAQYVWGLTGTPMPKDASDLYAPLYAICPGALSLPNDKTMTYWQFVKHFCKTRPGFGGSLQIYGSKNLDELKDRMAPFCLRRTKEDVFPQWNHPVISELWLEADDAMRSLDDTDEGRLMREAFTINGLDALQGLSESVATVRRMMGILIVAPLVKWLADSGLNKVVVVCYHREVIQKMHEELEKIQIASVIYWGGLNDESKSHIKQAFISKKEVQILLLQINAGGTGLDGLQHATGDIVFAEFSWIDDDNKQALGRLDRIGQTRPVLARFVGIEGSLHGDIMQAASRRAADNKTLFN